MYLRIKCELREGLSSDGGLAIREEEAGMARWRAEWSVTGAGEGRPNIAVGARVRGEGCVEGKWSRQQLLRGKVGMGGLRG